MSETAVPRAGNEVGADTLLAARQVSKTYRAGAVEVAAVHDVSLEVRAGEFIALVGPSGCGKSTLLSLCGGLLAPDSGTVSVAGVDLYSLSGARFHEFRRAHLGFVFQDYSLLRTLNAVENVMLVDELGGMRRAEARRHAVDALDRVGLGELAGRFVTELSGGQQQRVAIARAIAGRSRVIIADEPTGALDSANADGVLTLLREIVDGGGACLVATHDPAVAAFADRVVPMVDGAIESAGHR